MFRALKVVVLSGAHVLVADDDELMLAAVSDALVRLGANVSRALNGEELIEQLAKEGPFDLVVTDISMPWMSGLKAMRATRAVGLSTSVIVITGLDDERIPAQVRSLGPNAVLLRKPFELNELESVASMLLAKPGARRA